MRKPRAALSLLSRFLPPRDPVQRGFRHLGPWVTRFRIEGREYGGEAELVDDARVDEFFAVFPDTRTVLELGSLEGGHSFALARRAERIVAVEGRAANLEKARLVQQLLGVTNVGFVEANLEEADLAVFGRFDAIFCVGLLYHLPLPWRLIDRFASASPHVFLQTHFAANAETELEGMTGCFYREHGLGDPLSGLSPHSFWLTLPALTGRLETNGYTVQVLREEEHPHGPLVTLAAAL